METLKILMSLVAGGITVPLATWIKAKLPTDFPIQSVVIAAILNLGIVYLVSLVLVPGTPFVDLIPYALGAQVVSQGVHAVKKTTNGG